MRVEQSYPAPIHGVSTLAPRTRPRGYVSQQVNFRSDPVNKLTRRPPSMWRTALTNVSDPTKIEYHSYERAGESVSYLLDKVTGDVYCLVDDEVVETINLGTYSGENMGFYTIEDETYILNKDVVVLKKTDTDQDIIEKVSHINVKSALNYAETVEVVITTSDGVRHIVDYTVPDLGTSEPDYDAADKARATKQVAAELAARINGGGVYQTRIVNPDYPDVPESYPAWRRYCREYNELGLNDEYDPSMSICNPYLGTYNQIPVDGYEYEGIEGVTAVSLGSAVAVWEDGRQEWLQIEISSGQGDRTTVAINQVIDTTDGLPLYAVVGTRITVRPDPTTEKGTYYLQAERISDDPTGEALEEVVWSENCNPDQQHSIDSATMPHKIVREDNAFTLEVIEWEKRHSGDDDSVPFPDFVDNTITTMGYFQKRLVIVSENSVYMTQTDDLDNWFRQSAVNLLVNDPVGVASSELSTDKILYLVPHNRDLLCISRDAQFKISGSTAITPETVSMSLTTKYECQISVDPVTIGNSVYFPIDYGDSTGLQEYTGEKDTSQDFAAPITNHIIGYLEGVGKLMTASPNLEMIAMTTTTAPDNKLFIYEQYTEGTGKRSQRSWSQWEIAEDQDILDIRFRQNELILVVSEGTKVLVKAIPMYTRVTGSELDVFLDDMLILPTDGLTATLPDDYLATGAIAVRGEGTQNELWEVQYTLDNRTLTFNEDIGVGYIYVGKKYISLVEPTRPFKYDEDGSTITTDKIRVAKWVLSLVDTHALSMTKIPTYGDEVTLDFESRFVGGYQLGTIDAYTGNWKFSFAESADLARAVFSTDSYLGCTISDISWEGQYYKSKGRM